jgi:hypothetical protein
VVKLLDRRPRIARGNALCLGRLERDVLSRTFATITAAGKGSVRPRPCENHFAGHLGATLIQAVLLTRIKDTLRSPHRFFCYVLTRSSRVFTQPGPIADLHDRAGGWSGRLGSSSGDTVRKS